MLLGEVNPSGKIPETFPKCIEDCSAHANGNFPGVECVHYEEGIMVGYCHFDNRGIEPEFCFGHGLFYTEFAYDKLQVERQIGNEVDRF